MALIIEDGTRPDGANSYVDVATAQAFATARGLTVFDDAATCEQLLLKGMDYLEGLETNFIGERVERTQPLSWPRKYVEIQGHEYPYTELPPQLAKAQLHLAIEASAGDLEVRSGSGIVTQETISGALTVKYASPNGVPPIQRRTSDRYLSALTGGSGTGTFRTVDVNRA